MKRSRIFLGATTALLAVAGIAAAKMSNFGNTTLRYYATKINGGAICVTFAKINATAGSGSNVYRFTVSSAVYTLYTDGKAGTAGIPVQTGTNHYCTLPLLYGSPD